MDMEKCNCGREIRYSHFKKSPDGNEHEVFSCNKYCVCPTYEEVTHKFEITLQAAKDLLTYREGTQYYKDAERVIQGIVGEDV